MQKIAPSSRQTALGLLLAASVAIAGCGENRQTQCEKIAEIVNTTASQMQAASGSPNGFSQGAQLAEQAATQLESLKLGDQGLETLNQHLTAAYRQWGAVGQEMASIAGPNGGVTTSGNSPSNETIVRWQGVTENFQTVQTAVQNYCQGGPMPPEYSSPPAS